ncbi:ATP-binding protein [Zeaxanthinibacter sp. PT1]|uniref:ATP-binding protein n=1 Tax=Zeaxanthinibacter TaxID=561554 RepID=UPI0023491B47|nr:ATP-binding protein [Zeaxanthinibacter sp. PT1]MDC6351948.1 ATP-binding protein [Zeaxanthinibacter sp. PT1]
MNLNNSENTRTRRAPFRLGVAIAVVLLLLIAGITFRQIKNLQRSADLVSLSFQVDKEINNLFSMYNIMESAQFRSVIVRDSSFQLSYDDYKQQSEASLKKLYELTETVPENQETLDSVTKLKDQLHASLTLINSQLPDFRSQDPEILSQVRKADSLMNQLRQLKVKLVLKKEALLQERLSAYQSQSFVTHLTSLLLAIFSLIVFIIFFKIIDEDRKSIIRAETFLHSILQNTDNIINFYEPLYDRDGQIYDFKVTFANESNKTHMGKSPESLIGKPISKLFPFLLLNGEMDELINSYKEQKRVVFDRQIAANGQKMWFASVVRPLSHGLLIIARNSTEEKNAEEKLIRLNQELKDRNEDLDDTRKLLKVILESTDNTINHYEAVYDEQGNVIDFKILYVTENISNYIDLSAQEITGRLVSQVYPKTVESGSFEVMLNCIKTQQKEVIERKYVYEDRDLWFRTTLQPINNRLTATAINITHIKEAEKHLLHLNEELQIQNSILSNAEGMAKIGSYIWDIAQDNLRISDNFYHLLDREVGSIEPSVDSFMNIVHTDDKAIFKTKAEKSIGSLQPLEHTFRVVTNQGNIKYLKIFGQFMHAKKDPVMIGVAQDVTKQIKSERNLINRNRELKRSNAELESFNRVASHDLQEPLRKIQMFISRINDLDSISKRSQNYFEKITQAADRMQTLIKNLLTYSRIDSALEKIEEVDLNTVMENIQDNLSVQIKEVNLKIELDPLPTIQAVPFQMEQLFNNLISNAIKYRSPEEEPKVFIRSEEVRRESINAPFTKLARKYYLITVEDNGIGFKQENAERIFEIFQRLHYQPEYKGTGIGLAICKKIVENHRGYIQAFGKEGEGASFKIYLPYTTATNGSPVRDQKKEEQWN